MASFTVYITGDQQPTEQQTAALIKQTDLAKTAQANVLRASEDLKKVREVATVSDRNDLLKTLVAEAEKVTIRSSNHATHAQVSYTVITLVLYFRNCLHPHIRPKLLRINTSKSKRKRF